MDVEEWAVTDVELAALREHRQMADGYLRLGKKRPSGRPAQPRRPSGDKVTSDRPTIQ